MDVLSFETEVKQLIGLQQEGEYWDFKKEWHQNKADLLHDIICMANNLSNQDGLIIIGVDEENDYSICDVINDPTPSVYTNNAIVASDYVMIPLQAEEESTNNIQNYISYLIDLQEQFNPGLDMIGFVPYLVDTDSATIKSNLEELYKQHKEDNLVFQNIIKRSNKVSTWSKNGITEHKGYDKKVLSMYENVFFEMLERIIQLENEKE